MFTIRFVSKRAFPLAALGVFALSACAGCGSSGADTAAALIPVKGKVTIKGEPLAAGTVRFEPDDFGRPASGKLNADGTFVLSTLK
jgi:hypothetical protein